MGPLNDRAGWPAVLTTIHIRHTAVRNYSPSPAKVDALSSRRLNIDETLLEMQVNTVHLSASGSTGYRSPTHSS